MIRFGEMAVLSALHKGSKHPNQRRTALPQLVRLGLVLSK